MTHLLNESTVKMIWFSHNDSLIKWINRLNDSVQLEWLTYKINQPFKCFIKGKNQWWKDEWITDVNTEYE